MGNASEWDNITLRSRYAHEWDRWLHWWNRKDVQLMYNCSNPMGWLLFCAFETDPDKADLSAPIISTLTRSRKENRIAEGQTDICQAAHAANKFEEAFTDTSIHNALGVVTYMLGKKDIPQFINTYFSGCSTLPLKVIYDLLLCGMTYREINNNDVEAFEKSYQP